MYSCSPPQFRAELGGRANRGPPIEVVLVSPLAALYLPVALRASGRDVLMSNPQVAQMRGEIGAELP